MQSEAERPPQSSSRTIVFVSLEKLPAHGINYCRQYLQRLYRRGLFPKPYRLSANRVAWDLAEIEEWKASRPRVEREAAQ